MLENVWQTTNRLLIGTFVALETLLHSGWYASPLALIVSF